MQRIAIIGSSGAGKSTLARKLGDLLDLPIVHLDALHWRPGWVEPPEDEWRALQEAAVAQQRWIIDGNYGSTLDIRLAAADAIIFLDLPRTLCVWRIFLRWLRYRGRSRPDMAEGCPEKLDWGFVRWVWDYPHRSRPIVLEKLARLAQDKAVFVLRRPRDVARFLAQMREQRPKGGVSGSGARPS
jgi:adenylate kinase family enzyme